MVMTLPWPSTIRFRRAGLYSMVITSPGRNTRVVALCDCSRALSVSSGVSVFPTNDITGDESHVRPVEADSSADGRGPVSADCPEGTDVHALSPAINPNKNRLRIIKNPQGKNSTEIHLTHNQTAP